MSDLETLKAQHPEWCWKCGAVIPHPQRGGHEYVCFESPVIVAYASKLQQHEATISDLKADLEREQSALHLKEVYRKGLEAGLAKAQETIQQQARELEEADEALILYGHHERDIPELGVSNCPFDPEEGIACTCGFQRHLDAALARQSARSQQAETKKEG